MRLGKLGQNGVNLEYLAPLFRHHHTVQVFNADGWRVT